MSHSRCVRRPPPFALVSDTMSLERGVARKAVRFSWKHSALRIARSDCKVRQVGPNIHRPDQIYCRRSLKKKNPQKTKRNSSRVYDIPMVTFSVPYQSSGALLTVISLLIFDFNWYFRNR